MSNKQQTRGGETKSNRVISEVPSRSNQRNMELDTPGKYDLGYRSRNNLPMFVFESDSEKAKACQFGNNFSERSIDEFENISIQFDDVNDCFHKPSTMAGQCPIEADSAKIIATSLQDRKTKEARETIDEYFQNPEIVTEKDIFPYGDQYAVASNIDCHSNSDEDESEDERDENELDLLYVLDRNNEKKKLGQGAFGTVYLARNQIDKRKLAIKEILITKANQNYVNEEINIHQQLQHANIVKFEDFCEQSNDDGSKLLLIILEYIPGGSLTSLLMDDWGCGRQTEKVVFIYLSQLLNAVGFMHSKNIIHCDIKGANILISEHDGVLKLCDFGHAHQLPKNGDGVHTLNCGTPNYMAPETLKLPASGFGKPVDVWSIGCTAYEILMGKPPYYDCEAHVIMYKVGTKSMCPDIPRDVSPNLTNFFSRCFEFDPARRATVEELLDHPFITGLGSSETEKQPAKEPLETSCDDIIFDEYATDSSSINFALVPQPTIAKEMYADYGWIKQEFAEIQRNGSEDSELVQSFVSLNVTEDHEE